MKSHQHSHYKIHPRQQLKIDGEFDFIHTLKNGHILFRIKQENKFSIWNPNNNQILEHPVELPNYHRYKLYELPNHFLITTDGYHNHCAILFNPLFQFLDSKQFDSDIVKSSCLLNENQFVISEMSEDHKFIIELYEITQSKLKKITQLILDNYNTFIPCFDVRFKVMSIIKMTDQRFAIHLHAYRGTLNNDKILMIENRNNKLILKNTINLKGLNVLSSYASEFAKLTNDQVVLIFFEKDNLKFRYLSETAKPLFDVSKSAENNSKFFWQLTGFNEIVRISQTPEKNVILTILNLADNTEQHIPIDFLISSYRVSGSQLIVKSSSKLLIYEIEDLQLKKNINHELLSSTHLYADVNSIISEYVGNDIKLSRHAFFSSKPGASNTRREIEPSSFTKSLI